MQTAIPLGHYIVTRGYTYSEFARLLNMRQVTIAATANGETWPQLRTCTKIAKALGCTGDEVYAMLRASAQLQLTGETGQRLSRAIADMRRLASRIEHPALVTVREARAGRSSLSALIRRRRKNATIKLRRRVA